MIWVAFFLAFLLLLVNGALVFAVFTLANSFATCNTESSITANSAQKEVAAAIVAAAAQICLHLANDKS